MQVLTLDAVKTAARNAYAARTLTAQATRREDRRCEYQIGDCKCAIGAALSAEALDEVMSRNLNETSTVHRLWTRGVVEIATSEYSAIAAIQQAHDQWASAAHDPAHIRTERQVRNKREAFKKLIGLTVRN